MQEIELDVIRVSLFDARPLGRGRSATFTVLSGPASGDYEACLDGADRRYLYLVANDRNGQPVRPVPGTPVYVACGDPGRRCEFGSIVSQVQPEDAPPGCVAVLLPVEAQRMQRRRFMRVELAMPVRVARLPRQGEDYGVVLQMLTGQTTNIAGGGMSFTCADLQADPGDLIALTLALPGQRHVTATAEVLRCGGDGTYAVQFCDIDEQAQADLARYAHQNRGQETPSGPTGAPRREAEQSRRDLRR